MGETRSFRCASRDGSLSSDPGNSGRRPIPAVVFTFFMGRVAVLQRPDARWPPADLPDLPCRPAWSGGWQAARGWVTGYVVPALAGTMRGSLRVQGETVTFDGATGYHDHNWGFWQGVSWQWGQVAHENLSIVYGRIFPPADVADPTRVPAFLTALGPHGPLGFSTNVTID